MAFVSRHSRIIDDMTLDEAIAHAKDVGSKMICNCNTCECGKEHMQLAKWLEELKKYRKAYGKFLKSNDFVSGMEII